jgi:hypothetical protein
MGVQPPTDDDLSDGPDVVEFGIAALDARLEDWDLSYPVTAEWLVDHRGDERIPVDAAGSKIDLATAVERCGREGFESERDFLNALHPVFEAERERAGSSLMGQLRALLPF